MANKKKNMTEEESPKSNKKADDSDKLLDKTRDEGEKTSKSMDEVVRERDAKLTLKANNLPFRADAVREKIEEAEKMVKQNPVLKDAGYLDALNRALEFVLARGDELEEKKSVSGDLSAKALVSAEVMAERKEEPVLKSKKRSIRKKKSSQTPDKVEGTDAPDLLEQLEVLQKGEPTDNRAKLIEQLKRKSEIKKEVVAEVLPRDEFDLAFDKVASEKNLDDKLKASIRSFADNRGHNIKALERMIGMMRHVGLNKDEEKLVDAVSEIIKAMKEGPAGVKGESKETPVEEVVVMPEVGGDEVKKEIGIPGEKKDDSSIEDAVIVETGGDEVKKEAGVSGEKNEEEAEVPAGAEAKKIGGMDEEAIKKFMAENNLTDEGAIKREISVLRRNAPREKIRRKRKVGIGFKNKEGAIETEKIVSYKDKDGIIEEREEEIEKPKLEGETAERFKMLKKSLRYLKESPENLDKEIAELRKNISETQTELTGGNLSVEELGAKNRKLLGLTKKLERRLKLRGAENEPLMPDVEPAEPEGPGGAAPPGGDGPGGGGGQESPEPGRELTEIHNRIIAQMTEGRSLAGKKAELELISSRNANEQFELELIERAQRINDVVMIIAAAERKDPKEIWREHGTNLFRAYESYREEFIAGNKKEPNVKEFGMKLLEAIPGGGAGLQKLKENGGEAFKSLADKIDELFKEQDPQRRETKIGELQGAELMKQIMGEEGARNFWKMLGDLRRRRDGGGAQTPEEAARIRQELEAARSRLEGSAGLFLSVLGLVGLIFLMAVIFTLLIEIEAVDLLMKGKKH